MGTGMQKLDGAEAAPAFGVTRRSVPPQKEIDPRSSVLCPEPAKDRSA
jgi:hypothetical protein